jgi:uncharacterized protein (TIGR02186 family)
MSAGVACRRLARAALLGIAFATTGIIAAAPAAAQTVIADLSKRLVAITTGFAGTDVLLFGAVEGKGEVVVVVKGPIGRLAVRQKARVAGIWINRNSMTFANVPSFYSVSASAPLADVVPKALALRSGIGARFLDITQARGRAGRGARCSRALDSGRGAANAAILRMAPFCEALIRNKRREGLYLPEGRVTFLPGRKLFRTTIRFPANVPVGTYSILVYVVRDGQIVGSQTHPLVINKTGVEAEVFDFAHRYSAFYGLIAVALAAFAGWGAGQIFRKQ